MADSPSSRRSSFGVFTPLGFAPSGSPSGSPTPTGAQSYISYSATEAGHDANTIFCLRDTRVPIGVIGPQPSGAGFYLSNQSQVTNEHDTLVRLVAARPFSPIGQASGRSQPSGTGLYSQPAVVNQGHDVSGFAAFNIPLPFPVYGSSGGGGAGVSTYRLRARDAGAAITNPNRYVFWTSTTASLATYPGSPPFGGPLVELTIVSNWIA